MRHGSGSVTLTGHCSSHEGPQGPVQTSAAKSATRGGLKGFGSVARASKPGAKAALDAGQQAARGERSDRGAGLAVCPMRGCAKADRRWAIAGRDGHCAAPGAAGGVSPPCVAVVWHLRGVCASSAACQDPVREVPLQNETPRPHAKPVVRAKHTLGDEESGALARRGDRATKKARGAELSSCSRRPCLARRYVLVYSYSYSVRSTCGANAVCQSGSHRATSTYGTGARASLDRRATPRPPWSHSRPTVGSSLASKIIVSATHRVPLLIHGIWYGARRGYGTRPGCNIGLAARDLNCMTPTERPGAKSSAGIYWCRTPLFFLQRSRHLGAARTAASPPSYEVPLLNDQVV